MIAISDTGGSKSDWAFVQEGTEPIRIETSGFNPFTHNAEEYQYNLLSAFSIIDLKSIKSVFYYGAGTSKEVGQNILQSILRQVFPNSKIEINTDLLAAARATCRDSEGIACILGTGCNTGVYDGKQIIDSIPTLGYLVGDEGSGAHLGKLLIKSYFYKEMPIDIRAAFEDYIPGKHEYILDHLYNHPPANQFLGSLTRFASQHLDHPFIQKLLSQNFQDFVDSQLSKYLQYQSLPVHFVGSIAQIFKEELKKCLELNKSQLGQIIAKPLPLLIQYHAHEKNS